MSQLDIFGDEVDATTLPPVDDNRIGAFHGPASDAPETERAAAISVYPRTGTARRAVLDAIAAAGDRGMTDEEVALKCRLRLYTAAPRRNELVRDGWARDSDERRPTTTGTPAVVWVLTDEGRRQYTIKEGT